MCPAVRGSTVSYAGDAHFPKHSLEYSLNFWSQSKKKAYTSSIQSFGVPPLHAGFLGPVMLDMYSCWACVSPRASTFARQTSASATRVCWYLLFIKGGVTSSRRAGFDVLRLQHNSDGIPLYSPRTAHAVNPRQRNDLPSHRAEVFVDPANGGHCIAPQDDEQQKRV
jgi:hypothetical protein